MLIDISRWILGIGILAWGILSLRATLDSAAPFDAHSVLQILLAVGGIAVGSLLIARDFARFISRPILLLIENLYMPDSHAEKPPLSFRLGHFYAAGGRLRDAEKEYRRMLRYYPGATDGWIELMTLYWAWQPKPRRSDARQAFKRALAKAIDADQRSALAEAQAALERGELPVDFRALCAKDKAESTPLPE